MWARRKLFRWCRMPGGRRSRERCPRCGQRLRERCPRCRQQLGERCRRWGPSVRSLPPAQTRPPSTGERYVPRTPRCDPAGGVHSVRHASLRPGSAPCESVRGVNQHRARDHASRGAGQHGCALSGGRSGGRHREPGTRGRQGRSCVERGRDGGGRTIRGAGAPRRPRVALQSSASRKYTGVRANSCSRAVSPRASSECSRAPGSA